MDRCLKVEHARFHGGLHLAGFNTGVISDEDGKVVQNLLQEDKVAVRVTFRAGYFLARPPTDAEVANPCPVAIVKHTGSGTASRSGSHSQSRATGKVTT